MEILSQPDTAAHHSDLNLFLVKNDSIEQESNGDHVAVSVDPAEEAAFILMLKIIQMRILIYRISLDLHLAVTVLMIRLHSKRPTKMILFLMQMTLVRTTL